MTVDSNAAGHSHPLGRLQRPALIIGVVALVALIVGAFQDPEQFFRAYLFGFVFWMTLAVGCLALLKIQFLTGGVWGILIRRIGQAASRTMLVVALMFVPLAFGLHSIYEWTHAEVVAHDPILQQKASYLNPQFFIARGALYFVIWIIGAYLLNRWAGDYEREQNPWTMSKIRRISAGGLPVMAFSVTFASVDWIMSLDPHWYSTMFGLSFIVHCLLAGMAFCIIVAAKTFREGHFAGVIKPVDFRDVGNLQLAFVMLWAYTAFSEYMLIWYGNLLEEIPYFLTRSSGGWGVIAVLLIVFHFFLPFFMLLMRGIKDRPNVLRNVAYLLLLMHAIDLYWLIVPAFREHFYLGWMFPVAIVALGGIWLSAFFWQLGRASVLPKDDPYVQKSLNEGVMSHG